MINPPEMAKMAPNFLKRLTISKKRKQYVPKCKFWQLCSKLTQKTDLKFQQNGQNDIENDPKWIFSKMYENLEKKSPENSPTWPWKVQIDPIINI